MRYELSDYEWSVIKPMLPNKPRGVPRVDDRRVLNGIFWVLRSGAPWRDLPENYGPHTTCYNRFVRWRQAGIWDRIMNGLATAHDAAMQMIDTSIVRVHQHGACIAENHEQHMGRSRGGLTSKVHVVVDANGLPVRLGLTPARLMTIGSVRCFWPDCARKRLCWQIVATMPTGSGSSSGSKARGPTSRRRKIARAPSTSAPISTAHVTWSSGSLTRSSNAGVLPPVMTSSLPITSPSSSLPRSDSGYGLMNQRPSEAPGYADTDWASESFVIAEQAQTKYCTRQGASCDRSSGKVKIDAAYVDANTPIVREQLQKAGVRLAHRLDAALGK